jgi:hypothetical protein
MHLDEDAMLLIVFGFIGLFVLMFARFAVKEWLFERRVKRGMNRRRMSSKISSWRNWWLGSPSGWGWTCLLLRTGSSPLTCRRIKRRLWPKNFNISMLAVYLDHGFNSSAQRRLAEKSVTQLVEQPSADCVQRSPTPLSRSEQGPSLGV